jgi:hypothetical protein
MYKLYDICLFICSQSCIYVQMYMYVRMCGYIYIYNILGVCLFGGGGGHPPWG